jgi:hypothetical protein
LHHCDEGWVLGEKTSGGGFVEILCAWTRRVSETDISRWGNRVSDGIPSFRLDRPGCWALLLIGALLAGVFCGVLVS